METVEYHIDNASCGNSLTVHSNISDPQTNSELPCPRFQRNQQTGVVVSDFAAAVSAVWRVCQILTPAPDQDKLILTILSPISTWRSREHGQRSLRQAKQTIIKTSFPVINFPNMPPNPLLGGVQWGWQLPPAPLPQSTISIEEGRIKKFRPNLSSNFALLLLLLLHNNNHIHIHITCMCHFFVKNMYGTVQLMCAHARVYVHISEGSWGRLRIHLVLCW